MLRGMDLEVITYCTIQVFPKIYGGSVRHPFSHGESFVVLSFRVVLPAVDVGGIKVQLLQDYAFVLRTWSRENDDLATMDQRQQ